MHHIHRSTCCMRWRCNSIPDDIMLKHSMQNYAYTFQIGLFLTLTSKSAKFILNVITHFWRPSIYIAYNKGHIYVEQQGQHIGNKENPVSSAVTWMFATCPWLPNIHVSNQSIKHVEIFLQKSKTQLCPHTITLAHRVIISSRKSC